jgi:DNA-binding phage protein
LDEVSFDCFTQHPQEIEDFLQEIFADYVQDGDSVVLLSALSIIARVRAFRPWRQK